MQCRQQLLQGAYGPGGVARTLLWNSVLHIVAVARGDTQHSMDVINITGIYARHDACAVTTAQAVAIACQQHVYLNAGDRLYCCWAFLCTGQGHMPHQALTAQGAC
jgi:hypothetical protein